MKIMPIAKRIYEDPKYQQYIKSASGQASWPYLKAMLMDNYGWDNKSDVVNYFLANASHYQGEIAKECKSALKKELKNER